jgi:hypothetical protein
VAGGFLEVGKNAIGFLGSSELLGSKAGGSSDSRCCKLFDGDQGSDCGDVADDDSG